MVVRCEDVWREISNYIDGDVEAQLRAAMEAHLSECERCTAVLKGTTNIVQIYGDERMTEVPFGFSQRLHQRLDENMPRKRGTALGWMTAFALAALLLLSFQVGSSPAFRRHLMRSQLAQPGSHVPADMMVIVSAGGKTFHTAGCRFIHDKANLRTISAGEAVREGYVPCVRCMKKYLTEEEIAQLTATLGPEE
jgi:hypothetical protein